MKRITLLMVLGLVFGWSACKKEDSIIDIQPKHFLSDKDFDQLIVEVVSVDGYGPNPDALDNLADLLNQRLKKPAGITFVQRTIEPTGNVSFTANDLRTLEDEVRTEYAEEDKLAGYIFYADAEYAENTESSKVLGVAYSSTAMCIFKETIQDHSGGLGEASELVLESAVLMHEFGHVLGLVNNGTPMTQDHEGESGHCDNEDCLMYYAAETSDMLGILGGGSIPSLDDQCLDDLQANGGK